MNEDTTVATIDSTREVAVFNTYKALDFKTGIQLLSIEKQDEFFDDYIAKRNHFRKRLLEQMVEGVHYGFPPGCAPKLDRQGRPLVDPRQWKAKPCLYQAGAQFITEFTRVRPVCKRDMESWEMAGKIPGLMFIKCELLNPETGEILGEGSGGYRINKKGMDENAAIKMAEKTARTAAVINTFALSDLFTQDMELKGESLDESMSADFFQSVQEWVDELKVWPEYKVRKSEIMALRASLSIWVRGHIPNNAEAAMAWIRENVKPEIMHGKEGNATGLKFIVKREQKAEGDNGGTVDELEGLRIRLREWYDKAVAAGKKNDFAAVIEKVCKKPMKDLKTIEDFKTAIKAVAELESEWN